MTTTTNPTDLLPPTTSGPWSLTKVKIVEMKHADYPIFEATVLFEDKPAFDVSDDGRGGSYLYHPVSGQPRHLMEAMLDKLRRHAATLPPFSVEELGLDGEPMAHNDETLISHLVDGIALLKDLKRHVKSGRTVAFDPKKNKVGQTYTVWHLPPVSTQVQRALQAEPRIILLNDAIMEAKA